LDTAFVSLKSSAGGSEMFAALGLFAALTAALLQPESPKQTKALRSFQGSWTVESLMIDGKPVRDEDKAKFKLDVNADRWSVSLEGKQLFVFKMRLDESAVPKQIDFTCMAGDLKDKVIPGIYRFDLDHLTMCRHLKPASERPKDFSSTPGSGLILVTWKHSR
jgi:uncharacterized protein (TIGR03067 family)